MNHSTLSSDRLLLLQIRKEARRCEKVGSTGLAKLWTSAADRIEGLESELESMAREDVASCDQTNLVLNQYRNKVTKLENQLGDLTKKLEVAGLLGEFINS